MVARLRHALIKGRSTGGSSRKDHWHAGVKMLLTEDRAECSVTCPRGDAAVHCFRCQFRLLFLFPPVDAEATRSADAGDAARMYCGSDTVQERYCYAAVEYSVVRMVAFGTVND